MMLRRTMLKTLTGLTLLPAVAQRARAGARLKITDIRVVKLRLVQHVGDLYGTFRKPPLKTSYDIGGGSIIEVHTDQGLVGIGPGGTGAEINPGVINAAKNLLVGQDPFDIQAHAFALYGRPGGAYVEIALWDLIGKASNQPLYKLWGGFKNKVMPYASQHTLGTPEERAQMAVTVKGQGWKAIKFRASFPTMKEDVQLVEATRKAVGDDFIIMCDGNKAPDLPGSGSNGSLLPGTVSNSPNLAPWDFRRAVDTAREYQRLNVYWLEEPLPRFDFDELAELNRLVELPIAGGEANHGLHEFRWMLERGCFDILQPEVMSEGPVMMRTIADLTEAYDKRIVPHEGFVGLGTLCALHLVCSWPHAPTLEIIHEPPIGDYKYRWSQFTEPILLDKDGYMSPPDGPGLGVTINPDLIINE
jgi:D-galactarolactone cycloisomerase